MNIKYVTFETHAGRMPWSEQGLTLLARIQKEVDSITEEEISLLMCKTRIEYDRSNIGLNRHLWTPEATEFLYKNWLTMSYDELKNHLNISAPTIHRFAKEVLNLPHKRTRFIELI